MKVWGVTDVGLKRRDNQDAYVFQTVGALGAVVAVVCDGMGGVQGGQLASTLAVSTFLEELCTHARAGMTVEEIRFPTIISLSPMRIFRDIVVWEYMRIPVFPPW